MPLLSLPTRRKDPVVTALEGLGVRSRHAKLLAATGTLLTVDAGDVLCREGDLGAEAFLLVDGEALVHWSSGDRIAGPGEVLGEIAALNPTVRRTATVETTKPSTILVYDVRTFRALATEMKDLLAPKRAA